MSLILVALSLFVMGVLCITDSALLVFRPELFLRFYDWLGGDYVGKTAKWRRDVHTIKWKIFGMLGFAWGLVILMAAIRILLKS